MSLKLYFHPLSSFCMKVLTALYENDTPFEPCMVDFMNEEASAEFRKMWPIRQFPVLRDEARGQTVPESSIIIEYLAQRFPGKTPLLPSEREPALETRFYDRFFDLHVHVPMQKVVTDRLRPAGQNDTLGVDHARQKLRTAYDVLEDRLKGRTWAAGNAYTMADCAASPALFYGDMAVPIGEGYPVLTAYRDRLMNRPSFARALEEAKPYFDMVPK